MYIFSKLEFLPIEIIKGILWFYLFFDYLSLINQYIEIHTNKVHWELLIQISLFYIFFWNENIVISGFVIVLFISEMALRSKESKKDALMSGGKNNVSEKRAIDLILKDLLLFFQIIKKQEEEIKDKETIKIAVLNAVSFLLVMLSFLLRIAIELTNMFLEEYNVPIEVYIAYITLMGMYFVVEVIKGKTINIHLARTLVNIICTAISVYLFVFAQKESINFVVLLMSLYFAIPFLVGQWRIGRKYRIS